MTSCSRSLSPGDHHDLVPGRHRLRGQGGDDVVGLEPRRVDDGQAEDLADPAHVGQLHREVVLHLPAVRLVLAVLLVAEGGPGEVEGDADPLRVLVLVQLAQHRGEAVDGVAGQAARRGEALDREVGAVELGAAVDQVDRVLAAHGSILLIESALHAARARPVSPPAALRGCVAYEYEHEFWIRVDGSGTVNVTGRPELWTAFKGVAVPAERTRPARRRARLFEESGLRVRRVTITRRGGRPYLFVSADFDDVNRLAGTRRLPRPRAWRCARTGSGCASREPGRRRPRPAAPRPTTGRWRCASISPARCTSTATPWTAWSAATSSAGGRTCAPRWPAAAWTSAR